MALVPMRIDEVRVERLDQPFATQLEGLVLSWKLRDPREGAGQGACQVVIKDSSGKSIWNSGKMAQAVNELAYSGTALAEGARFKAEITVWDKEGAAAKASTVFGTRPNWKPVWIQSADEVPQPDKFEALPVTALRQEFKVGKPVRSATLYATALGLYEASINGKRVGDIVLAPEWTDYHKRVLYQAYDVTGHLRGGANAIGVLLGDGWYAGRMGMAQSLSELKRYRAIYGRVPSFAALLHVEYRDGTTQDISTDGLWRATKSGPWRSADLLDGVVFDANKETKNWDKAGFEETGWTNVRRAVIEPLPLVQPQINEPIRVVEKLKPITTKNGVVDFGQNMPGWVRLKVRAQKGAKITVHHAEMLKPDGHVYTENLRGAPQIDTYISDGTTRWYEPKFTFHGFRYIEVSGGELIESEAIVFCTAAPEVSQFDCSDPMLNRLWKNVLWTARANLMSVPTDCPQRDERLGWMGDILAFGTTSVYFFDMNLFLDKFLEDTRDAQADDGRFSDFSPHPYGRNRHFTGVPGWGDAGVGVARVAWDTYDRKDVARAQAPAIEKYLAWLESKNPDDVWRNSRGNDYGDWLNGDTIVRDGWPRTGGECPKDVFATLCWYRSALDAVAMGSSRKDLPGKIAAAFNKEFVTPDGKIKGDTQAGYSLALWLDILPESLRSAAFSHLLASIERTQWRLTTGFHSTLPIMEVLVRFGRSDVAYRLILNKQFPSWGYTIANGATTIWERWDGFVEGRGFQDPGMNSFNHWAFGSVGKWMMENIIGIQVDGYRDVSVEPNPGGGLTYAKGQWESPCGPVKVSWALNGKKLEAQIEVPPGLVLRSVELPGLVKKGVGSGKHSFVATLP